MWVPCMAKVLAMSWFSTPFNVRLPSFAAAVWWWGCWHVSRSFAINFGRFVHIYIYFFFLWWYNLVYQLLKLWYWCYCNDIWMIHLIAFHVNNIFLALTLASINVNVTILDVFLLLYTSSTVGGVNGSIMVGDACQSFSKQFLPIPLDLT